MTWQSFVAALVAYLTPLVLDWLKQLLQSAQFATADAPDDPALAVHDAFAAARAQLGTVWLPWHWWKLRALAAAERAALAHATQLAARAKGVGPDVVMTGVEYDAVTGA